MTHLVSVLVATIGFVCLCLSMQRHQADVLGRSFGTRRSRALRVAGWCVLGVALSVTTAMFGFAYGLIAWTAHLSIGAALVVAALTGLRSGGFRGYPPHG